RPHVDFVGHPHYAASVLFPLSGPQKRGADAIAAGRHVLLVGEAASGKSEAIRAGLSRRHVTVSEISKSYTKTCNQLAEDRLHAGFPKMQVGTVAGDHLGRPIVSSVERLVQMATSHVKTNGSVCIVSWDESVLRSENAVFQILRSK